MPILTHPASGWIDPDGVDRPVVAFGAVMAGIGTVELDFHRHMKGQVLLVQQGALSCEVEGGLWIVPPRSAIWIPGGAMHAIKAAGTLEGVAAFIDPTASGSLPAFCCAVSVSPLLRELLARSASLPTFYQEGGANSRLVAVLLDELARAQIEDLHLPMPSDPRLRRVADRMIAAPAARQTLEAWASQAGLSERSLTRALMRETGMSFDRWRRQLSVMLAVKWLAAGASIQSVSADLGYESVPSFVTMFRRVLGVPPGRYMAGRRAGTSPEGSEAGNGASGHVTTIERRT